MSNELFREVDEEVRQDQYQQLLKRYGIYVAATVVMIVGVAIAFVAWREASETARVDDSERFLAAVSQEQTARDAAIVQLREIAEDGTPGYQFLASVREATLLARDGEEEQAVAIFDSVAADSDLSRTYRDLASLLAVANGMEVLSREEVQSRIGALDDDTNPFRYTAREFLALAAMRDNDTEAATAYLRKNVEDATTPVASRARAGELLALIGN